MKRTILVAALFALFINCINAQVDRDAFHFGVKAGANYSNVYDIKGEDFTADFKFGFAGGIFLSIPLGEFLGIQPEALYSQKGYETNGNILGATFKLSHTTNYIDFPILLQIKPADFMSFLVGPQYSYQISTKNDFSSSLLSAQQQQDYDNINIRKNIFGVVAGIDFNVEHVVIGTRVGWDLMHNNGDGTSTSPRYRNLCIQATLGFRF